MKRRVWGATAFAVAGVLALAACSTGGSTTASAGIAPSTNGKGKTLNMWIIGEGTPLPLQKYLITEFHKETKGTLKIENQQWSDIVTKLTTSLPDKNNTPDVTEMGNTQSPSFTNVGAFLDISSQYKALGGSKLLQSFVAAGEVDATALSGKTVGVIRNSAHEKFLTQFFPEAKPAPFEDFVALHRALKAGDVELAFADGLTLAIWLGGEDAADCCAFRGGPFLESRFFGEGVGIAVRKEDAGLRRALDYALARVWASGQYAEIFRKYFPLSFY